MFTQTTSRKRFRFFLLAAAVAMTALPGLSRADDCNTALAPLMAYDSTYRVPFKFVYNRADSKYVSTVVKGLLTPHFFLGTSQLFGDGNPQLFSDRFVFCGIDCFGVQPFDYQKPDPTQVQIFQDGRVWIYNRTSGAWTYQQGRCEAGMLNVLSNNSEMFVISFGTPYKPVENR